MSLERRPQSPGDPAAEGAHRMGKDLTERRLVYEQPAGREHPRNLRERRLGPGNVIAGSEVHDQIERGIGKRHAPHVSRYQLGGDAGRGES